MHNIFVSFKLIGNYPFKLLYLNMEILNTNNISLTNTNNGDNSKHSVHKNSTSKRNGSAWNTEVKLL
jgi:hypothetical protein